MKIGDKFFEKDYVRIEDGVRKVILWTVTEINEEENRVTAFDGASYKSFKLSQIMFDDYIRVN